MPISAQRRVPGGRVGKSIGKYRLAAASPSASTRMKSRPIPSTGQSLCYPARLSAAMTMKNAITTSLTTHEFVFIQSRTFGKKACAR
jgi:hypothetical protein